MAEITKIRGANTPAAYRPGIVAVLDVGTSKTVCLIGRSDHGKLQVIGAALRESNGMRAGIVTNLREAQESIMDAVAAAEAMADTRIQNVLLSVNCGQPTSVTGRAIAALDGELVSNAHLRVLLQDGRAKCRLDGHEIIQVAPTSYVVDEARGVKNPLGMYCQRIGVAMHAVAVRPSPLHNLKLAVENSHLNVVATQFGAYAAGYSSLTDDEKQLGATVIDLGGGCTSVAVFNEGHLVHADVIPMGGQQVTEDLSRMFTTPLSAAERIKTLWGAALGDLEANADVIAVPQMGEDEDGAARRIPRSMLTRVIQARIEEILGHVQQRLRASGYDVAVGRRAVLTGGGSQLSGVRDLAERVLNKQVRLGRPQMFLGMPASAGPDYATAVGLLMVGATMAPEALNPERADEPEQTGGWFKRLTGGLLG
ncbi:MAG TPA: cell division protein FtsA [Rhizomicrobium sp.]|nr:cell division protein FtsA [Rhizomicrobium sp.]